MLTFALASFLIELTPGPNMTYLALVAAGKGRRAGLATVAGVALGLAIVGIAGALGATAAITASETAYSLLRWGGVAFLLYLAWDGWRGEELVEGDTAGHGNGKHFLRGLMTNLLNPKAAVFYVTVLPTFVDASGSLLVHTLALTAIYVAVATAIHLFIVLAAGSVAPLLTDPAREKIARRVLSLLLACVAVWFAVKTGQ
ncbi:MAG: LysE family translocator [Brucellaceae bacterium]|nr:LysE family translocator [Brucellaceae bacterium]